VAQECQPYPFVSVHVHVPVADQAPTQTTLPAPKPHRPFNP